MIGSNRTVKPAISRTRQNSVIIFTARPVTDTATKLNFEAIQRKLADVTKNQTKAGA